MLLYFTMLKIEVNEKFNIYLYLHKYREKCLQNILKFKENFYG